MRIGARARVVVVASVVAMLASSGAARVAAQGVAPSTSDDTVRAEVRRLFEEGLEAAGRADWPAAIDRFSRARGLRPSLVLAYNLAAALTEAQRYEDAARLIAGVEECREGIEVASNEACALLRQLAAEVGAHVTLPAPVESASPAVPEPTAAQSASPALPAPALAEPESGLEPQGPAVAPAPHAPAPEPSAGAGLGTLVGWALVGAGVVAVGVSVPFFLHARDIERDRDEACTASDCSTWEGWDENQKTIDRNNILGYVTSGAGVVALAAGAYVLFTSGDGNETSPPVSAGCTPESCSVVARVQF